MATEPPITGYLDRFSHRPGETFTAHVSTVAETSYDVRLVRVLGGDPNPAGPGMRLEDLSAIFAAHHTGCHRATVIGSYGMAPGPVRASDAPCTWTVLVWTADERPLRAVFSEGDAMVLRAGTAGVEAVLGGVTVSLASRIAPRRWHRIWLSADPATGRIFLALHRLDDGALYHVQTTGAVGTAPARVLFAAEAASAPGNMFTGKLEAPAILAAYCDTLHAIAAAPLLAGWDFARDIGGALLEDVGGQGCNGIVVNMPTRAVVGAHWTGAEHCWRHAPSDYAAIHFHDDDLDDCAWPASFTWTVPDDLPSGAYALELSCPTGRDLLPLYVLAKHGGPFAKVAFLASTFTYQVYGNHARGNSDASYRARVAAWGASRSTSSQMRIWMMRVSPCCGPMPAC